MTNAETIQKVIKIFRVFSAVCIVFCICGTVYSVFGLAVILIHHFIPGAASQEFIAQIAEYVGHGEFNHSLAFLLSCLFTFICDGYLHRCFHHYLDYELREGTPFTERGAKLVFIDGIKTIALSTLLLLLNQLIHLWLDVKFTELFSLSPNIEFGLALILLSKVILTGCEMIQKNREKNEQIEALERENSELTLEMQMRTSSQSQKKPSRSKTKGFSFSSLFTKSKK